MWGADLLVFDSLPSTNTWTLEHASELRHGDTVRAIRQPGGKGRFDRTWVAPGRCCLTLSAIVNPSSHADFPDPLLLSVTAIAVRETLAEFGVKCMLKWPNDVMTANGKIAGILAEKDEKSGAVVLGIGINVNITGPALEGLQFEPPPVSMAVERERLFDVDRVCKRLLVYLEKDIDFAWLNGPASIAGRWNEADFLAGKKITVKGPDGEVGGQYRGIQESGELCLVDAAGEDRLFWSGDVSVARNT